MGLGLRGLGLRWAMSEGSDGAGSEGKLHQFSKVLCINVLRTTLSSKKVFTIRWASSICNQPEDHQ